MSRSLSLTPEQQSGKASFKALVKSFGGQDAAAEETGVRRQKISDMGLANVAESPTLDLIDALEDRTVGMPGWPHVTSWLCRRRGAENKLQARLVDLCRLDALGLCERPWHRQEMGR